MKKGVELSFTVAGSITDLHPAASQSYDAIVMNLHIPGTDGLGLCRRLRREARKAYTVLIVIERDTPDDKLIGLEAGAVGYMVKPFKVRELDARLYALIRRSQHQVSNEKLAVRNMMLEPGTLKVTRAGRELLAQPIGMKLLAI